jgi:hypothetical protein
MCNIKWEKKAKHMFDFWISPQTFNVKCRSSTTKAVTGEILCIVKSQKSSNLGWPLAYGVDSDWSVCPFKSRSTFSASLERA